MAHPLKDFTFLCTPVSNPASVAESNTLPVLAHRIVLAKNSPWFCRQFSQYPSCNTLNVSFSDNKAISFIVGYMYEGSFTNIKDSETLVQCVQLSVKFELHSLLNLLLEEMVNTLSLSNALKFFILAYELAAESVKSRIADFIFVEKNYSTLSETSAYATMQSDLTLYCHFLEHKPPKKKSKNSSINDEVDPKRPKIVDGCQVELQTRT